MRWRQNRGTWQRAICKQQSPPDAQMPIVVKRVATFSRGVDHTARPLELCFCSISFNRVPLAPSVGAAFGPSFIRYHRCLSAAFCLDPGKPLTFLIVSPVRNSGMRHTAWISMVPAGYHTTPDAQGQRRGNSAAVNYENKFRASAVPRARVLL